jgi:hypothetical protein
MALGRRHDQARASAGRGPPGRLRKTGHTLYEIDRIVPGRWSRKIDLVTGA